MKTTTLLQEINSRILNFRMLLLLLVTTQFTIFANATQFDVAKPPHKKTIMLITGAFVSNSGWDEWKSYYESKDYNVIAPAWPHKEGTADVLRLRKSTSLIAELTLQEVVDYHARIIDALPEKPILVGHSFGGLIVQLLVQQGKASVGVAYHSVPPKGVLTTKFSFIKSLWSPLGLFRSVDKSYLMSFSHW